MNGPVATSGDPTELPPNFSLNLAACLLDQPECVDSIWPSFSELRPAARAPRRNRLRLVVSALISEARLVFGACLLLSHGNSAASSCSHARIGSTLHAWICSLLEHASALLTSRWHWTHVQCQLLHAQLSHLASPVPWSPTHLPDLPFSCDSFCWDGPGRPFPAAMCAFLHVLRVGAPWAQALDIFANLSDGYLSPDGRIFVTALIRERTTTSFRRVELSNPDDPDALTLFLSPTKLVAVASSHSLLPRLQPTPSTGLISSSRGKAFPSRFLPPYIQLKKKPARDIMSVFLAAPAWHRRLGPLDATTAAIIAGKLQMPKPRLPLRPSIRPNHASWERNETAKLALGPKFATWAWQGIVEIVPRNCPLPLFIEPLGAVDKATDPWWRLILDARRSNEFQDPWGVWYFSASQLAALLDPCDVMFAEDLEDAYHLSIFSGCTGKPFWSYTFAVDVVDGVPQIVQKWRLVMGCDAYSCLGLCDKAMRGFSFDGFVGRFAAAHFGQRNAGSPLNVLMRCIQRFLARRGPNLSATPHSKRVQEDPAVASLTSPPPPRRGLGPQALLSAIWVDDAVYITKTPPHPPCLGLVAGCPVCVQASRAARRSQVGWHRLASELGLGLSEDKRQSPSQRVTYTGVTIDTFHRTISIPPDKKVRLAKFLDPFLTCRSSSASDLASLRGRVQHYSACLPYILPFVALFSSVLETQDEPVSSRQITIPTAVNEASLFIREVLEDYAVKGRSLWPFVPSTLYTAFLANETGPAHVAVITWDASLHGWGMVLRWWDNKNGEVVVGTLPDTADMLHQVRRETLAGVLAVEAAARIIDLSCATVILRNDAVGALTALRKGSFASTFLQQCAIRFAHLQRRIRCNTLFLHAPGRVLVDEGVDDLSRMGALDIAGPVSSPRVRELSLRLAASCGWKLTVDAFASEANSFLPRFFARYAEPAAEAEDAFTVPDWACSSCPACGNIHRETLFAYPPPPMLNRFVAKARADGASAIVITPLAVAAPFWNKLLRASVNANSEGYVRVRHELAPPESDAPGELAIFAVDFSPSSPRPCLTRCSPACGKEFLLRGRPLLGSVSDQAERARIHAELDNLSNSLERQ